MEKNKLNPCPACGSEALLLKDKDYYATRCSNNACVNSTYRTYDSEEAAVAGWNSRLPEEHGETAES